MIKIYPLLIFSWYSKLIHFSLIQCEWIATENIGKKFYSFERKIKSNLVLNFDLTPGSFRVNRPGVAGALLQTPPSLINSVTHWCYSFRSSEHHKSQTAIARELTFWENVHTRPCVMRHVAHITCEMSPVMCHLSPYFFILFLQQKKMVELVAGGSVINGADPV